MMKVTNKHIIVAGGAGHPAGGLSEINDVK